MSYNTVVNEDKVFAALADANRRKIIEFLHQEDTTLLELAEHFPFSFQALSKHVKILEQAQLLTKAKQGKYRVLSLNREALKSSLQWMTYYANFWNQSFDKLEHLIQQQNQDGQSA